MIKLPFLSDQKFVITIGDDGAILTFVDKGKLVTRLFASSPSANDRREFNTLLLKHPTVPIYVLLDSIEQTYTKQSLPAVSALSIGKLVKKRLNRDFAKTDIKGAMPMGRDKSGRKDWLYMFVSTPATSSILEWLEYFSSLPNSFDGLHLLPIEMESIVKDINKALFKADAEKKNWQFIVTHNKTGGFRQTVLHNNQVIFTRLIRPGKESLPDIIAGNIEQEIINTVDYLRRLGLSDNDSMNIFVIVSKELKNSLETTKIRGKSLLLFTPFEIGKMLGHEEAVGKEDKFADILLAMSFAVHKPILKLENPKAKTLDNLLLTYKISSIAVILIIPTLAIYSGVLVFDIAQLNSKMKNIEDKKVSIEKAWKDVKNTGEYDIDDANKITDAISLHKKILDERRTPIDFLENLAAINSNFILLQSFTWNYDKDYAAQGKKEKVSSVLNLDFSTKDSSLDAMFKNYDTLSTALNEKFTGFSVEISKLPEKITFDNKTESLPLQVKLGSKDPSAAATQPAGTHQAPGQPGRAPIPQRGNHGL